MTRFTFGPMRNWPSNEELEDTVLDIAGFLAQKYAESFVFEEAETDTAGNEFQARADRSRENGD